MTLAFPSNRWSRLVALYFLAAMPTVACVEIDSRDVLPADSQAEAGADALDPNEADAGTPNGGAGTAGGATAAAGVHTTASGGSTHSSAGASHGGATAAAGAS